ncbi:MAG: hypothetical protein ACI9KE_000325 [Polyangiales bacterium]|jgi:hypothetical protein
MKLVVELSPHTSDSSVRTSARTQSEESVFDVRFKQRHHARANALVHWTGAQAAVKSNSSCCRVRGGGRVRVAMERAELRVPLSGRREGINANVERMVSSCLSLEPMDRPTWAQVILTLGKCAGDAETDVAIADPLLGTMVGSYRIEHQLGEGGMGTVYRGVHPRIGNHVAIKILHGEIAQQASTVRRFEREAKATGTIGSPYIPQIFDFGTLPDGRPYAVMEFFPGESVRERVEAQGAMPLAEVRDALLAATEALRAAHEKKIIHRDIKPDNLFLVRGAEDATDSIRVLDFAGKAAPIRCPITAALATARTRLRRLNSGQSAFLRR